MQRTSGILLHPTALAGPFKIGDLGNQARLFIDFLAKAGQSVWQILPLGPTGYGHSPYNALSAFAGNPTLIDLQQLVDIGELEHSASNMPSKTAWQWTSPRYTLSKTSCLWQPGNAFSRQQRIQEERLSTLSAENRQTGLMTSASSWPYVRNFRDRHGMTGRRSFAPGSSRPLQEHRAELAQSCLLYKYQQFVFAEQWQNTEKLCQPQGH